MQKREKYMFVGESLLERGEKLVISIVEYYMLVVLVVYISIFYFVG